MRPLDCWLLHVSTFLVGGTGMVYAWMRYVHSPTDEFAVVNHPLQPLVQHAHIWVAPLLVFAMGHVWVRHAWTYWRSVQKEGRRSGSTLLLMAAPMVLSGYFIQTSVSDTWRLTWTVLHGATAALWLFTYLAHLVSHWKARRVGTPAPLRGSSFTG